MEDLRKELIETILDVSGDEMNNKLGLKTLALENEHELTIRLMNIAYSLKDELNTL